MAEQSLKDKTVKGVGWSAIDNISQYAVSFVISIILARLLSPDDYGILGIIAIFTAVCGAIINGGFTDALIRKKEVTEDDYNTSFVVNLCMSVFLFVLVFFAAPLIAVFFERSELVKLIRVSSVTIIVGALALVQQTQLIKKIDFKTQTKITLISTVLSGLVGILMAVLGFGVWSLVIQGLLNQTVRTILLWLYNRWIPKLIFSTKSFNDLFGFGWKMMLIAFINSLWKELYQVVVGKFYSPATLGQYTRAKHFSQIFSSNLTNVVQRVSFPVLSNIQDDKPRMISAYRRIIKTTMFIASVAMFTLGALSEPLIYCLIGPKWYEASTYLPLICVAASLYPLHAINLNMLQVQGRSDIFLGIEIIKKIIGLLPLYIGAVWGIIPMLLVNLVTGIFAFFLNSFYTGMFLGYSSWMQIKDVIPSYGVAFAIAVPVWLLKYLPFSFWIILPIQFFFSVVMFWGICQLFKLDEYKEIKFLIEPLLRKILFRRK